MTGQDLKNSILQLAIQGKLVPQDANDEPASVLLERIKAEKKKLIEEKKIKKEKPLAEITEDEIPFEIPESWVWCRIGEIFLHVSGKQQSSNNKKEGTIRDYITTSNLYWGRFELDVLKSMYFTDEEIKTCSATKGDLLVCEGGAGYGRSAIWPYDYDICLQNHVHRLRPLVKGICEYVYYIIYLLKETNQLASVGTAMPGLSANRLKEILVPLPPLSEQRRIVAKIEELMPLIDEYDKAQKELDALNSAMPEQLKQSLLQEAIMGKLDTNNPDDEPASELLKRIREEKVQLIKEKKIKKEKPLPEITEEEMPFEIPENWEWCRIPNIGVSQLGKTKNPNQIEGTQKKYLCSINVYWNKIDLSNEKYMLFTDDEIEKYQVKKGDLLICEGGDCGRAAIWDKEDTTLYQNALHRVRFYCDINPHYIYYCLSLFYQNGTLNDYIKGETIKHLVKGQLDNILIPLPPLAEQHRIVEKLDALLPMISELAKSK